MHPGKNPKKYAAAAVAAGRVVRVDPADLLEIWGEQLEDPQLQENLKKTLQLVSATVDDPEQSEDIDMEQAEESAEASEDQASSLDEEINVVRKKNAALGITHCAKDSEVYVKYLETAKNVCKNVRSAKNNAARLSQFLSFAEKQDPDASPWDHLVDHNAADGFLKALAQCKSKRVASGRECYARETLRRKAGNRYKLFFGVPLEGLCSQF